MLITEVRGWGLQIYVGLGRVIDWEDHWQWEKEGTMRCVQLGSRGREYCAPYCQSVSGGMEMVCWCLLRGLGLGEKVLGVLLVIVRQVTYSIRPLRGVSLFSLDKMRDLLSMSASKCLQTWMPSVEVGLKCCAICFSQALKRCSLDQRIWCLVFHVYLGIFCILSLESEMGVTYSHTRWGALFSFSFISGPNLMFGLRMVGFICLYKFILVVCRCVRGYAKSSGKLALWTNSAWI